MPEQARTRLRASHDEPPGIGVRYPSREDLPVHNNRTITRTQEARANNTSAQVVAPHNCGPTGAGLALPCGDNAQLRRLPGDGLWRQPEVLFCALIACAVSG